MKNDKSQKTISIGKKIFKTLPFQNNSNIIEFKIQRLVFVKSMKRMIFIGVGVVVILATLVWGILTYQFINQASIAQGEVIKLNSGGSHPEVKFMTSEGKEIEYPQGGLIFGYKVADKVEVFYDSQNPKRASINSIGALWGFPVLIFVIGVVFVVVALF